MNVMFDKTNLIYVSKCVHISTFKDDKGVEVNVYKLSRSLNGNKIESERTIKPYNPGYYYPRPFNKKMNIIASNGVQYESYVTICRVGEPYEFPL